MTNALQTLLNDDGLAALEPNAERSMTHIQSAAGSPIAAVKWSALGSP